MRLASGTVLGLAAVVSSPALYQGLVTGELPIDLALTRYLLAVVLVWGALSVVVSLVGSPAPAAGATTAGAGPDGSAGAPAPAPAPGAGAPAASG